MRAFEIYFVFFSLLLRNGSEGFNPVASFSSVNIQGGARFGGPRTLHGDDQVVLRAQYSDSVELTQTSRRELLSGVSALALGSILLKTGGGDDLNSGKGTWLADPGAAVKAASDRLAREASAAAMLVTDETREAYRRDGVVVVRGAIGAKWIDALREACEVAQDEAGPNAQYLNAPTDEGTFFTDLEMARRLPEFAAFALHGPAAAVAGAVMESQSVRYLYDQIFVKERGVSVPTPWHQDQGYWRVNGEQVASVFVPMDRVGHDDCLQFVRGSNGWNLHNPNHFADGTPYRGTGLPAMPDIDAWARDGRVDLKTFELNPGDALVFSGRTAHGGMGNWGRALSTRWAGDDVTFWARPGEGAVPTGDVKLRDGAPLGRNAAAFPLAWQER